MVKWFSFLLLVTVLCRSNNQESNHGCSYQTLLDDGKQITCFNITSMFFQYSVINLQKSRWLICDSCNLTQITNETFNFPKNTINYLILNKNNVISINNFSFLKLQSLKVISLKNNLLTDLEPRTFYGLKRLLQLDLSKNFLERLGDGGFSYLENLDILNLNFNNISQIEPHAFVGLVNLKYLYINDNRLAKLDRDVFKYLVNLKILFLERNQITEIHPLAFNKLENLNFLYLNNNSIAFLTQYNFKHLSNLTDLQLRHNKLTDLPTSTFNGLRSLKFLYLGHNNLSSVQRYGLVGLSSLKVLELIANNFHQFTINHLRGMESLAALWLDDNKIHNLSSELQSDVQKSLKVFSIANNNLSSFDYELLYQKMPQLQEIWIEKNPWGCDFLIEMYDYFSKNNVSVCSNHNCSSEAVRDLKEKICFEPFENETDLLSDFVLDGTSKISFRYVLLLVPLLNFCQYFVVTTSF